MKRKEESDEDDGDSKEGEASGEMPVLVISIAALILLFCCSAFFSSSESALFSLDPLQIHRIREKHPGAADRIEHALSMPTRLLSAILVGNTLVNVVAAALGYAVLEDLLPARGVLIAIPVMTMLLLIFGEISPKRVALRFPEKLAVLYAKPLDLLIRAMTPATRVLGWVARLLAKWLVPTPKLTEAEFRTALDESEQRGVLDREERSILDGIIRLEGLTAGDVMTPRVDVVAVDVDDPPEEIARIARDARFKHLPVYNETPDRIRGFLDVRRFLVAGGKELENALLPPMFVPLSTPLNKLMVTLQRKNRRAVCVVDEFGGTAGIVTKGDVMEEIIAEAPLAASAQRVGIKKVDANHWQVGGDTSLEEINAELGLDLSAEGATRIGGWFSEHLKRIPRRGDTIGLSEYRLMVRTVRNRRVSSVVLERRPGEELP